MLQLNVDLHLENSLIIDEIRLTSCGTLYLLGWRTNQHGHGLAALQLAVNGAVQLPLQRHYHPRPDVPSPETAPGFCVEYILPPMVIKYLELLWHGRQCYLAAGLDIRCETPDYDRLRTSTDVFGRADIYGFGPPAPTANPEVLAFARRLPGPVLDFGCGIGALVHELHALDIEASGLELDRAPIRNGLDPVIVPHIRLYDGIFPSPYPDKSFESVVCSEVLEHIADYRGALGEIRRLARSRALFTVPDISVIPMLHKHNVVPWHLLESTHVNFFTQRNFDRLLREFFEHVEFARIGGHEINGTRYWVNLVAICRGPFV